MVSMAVVVCSSSGPGHGKYRSEHGHGKYRSEHGHGKYGRSSMQLERAWPRQVAGVLAPRYRPAHVAIAREVQHVAEGIGLDRPPTRAAPRAASLRLRVAGERSGKARLAKARLAVALLTMARLAKARLAKALLTVALLAMALLAMALLAMVLLAMVRPARSRRGWR